MEKLTLRQSWNAMTSLFKKSGRKLLVLLLLILLPALVIRVYSFQTIYGGFAIRYDLLDEQTLNEALLKGDISGAAEQFARMFPDTSGGEMTATDTALEVVFYLLSLALDLGVLYIGLSTFNGVSPAEKYKKRWFMHAALQLILISLFMKWVISRGQAMVMPMVLQTAALAHFSAFFGLTAILTTIFSCAAALFFVVWLMLFLQVMAILCVSGRTRVLMSFGYAREILRGRIWREMLHLLPFTLLSFLIPALMQALAMLTMSTPALGLTLAGVSLVLEAAAGMMTWLFLIPDVFWMERQSGIREKIRAAMKERENRDDTGE